MPFFKRAKKKPKLNATEKRFLNTLKNHYPHLMERISLDDAPYVGSGYRSDLVLNFSEGEHPYLKGVVIEIQGGTRQGWGKKDGVRTGHSTPQAIARDNHKCVMAQLNGFFYMPVVTTPAAYNAAIEVLNQLVYNTIDFEPDDISHLL